MTKYIPSLLLALSCAFSASAQLNTAGTPWENEDFLSTPSFKVIEEDSIQSIIFESIPYKGAKKSVFAYYSSPEKFLGEKSDTATKRPGIILVHGGGGTAFREWVAMWAKRGYAALALDTRGNGPDRQHLNGGFDENGKETPYFDVTLPLNEQWVYQAVGDVVNAHSLLRSFTEVDTTRTAITGISWGGVLTCIASSLDSRFKAAVPVYGCGYLWQSGKMKEQLNKLSEDQKETWIKQYDPSRYLSLMTQPILFLNGTNDVHFYLSSTAQSASLPSNSSTLIKQGLRHSHKYGWQNDEIEIFINHNLTGGIPLPEITNEKTAEGNTVTGKISSRFPIKDISLNYTTDSGEQKEKYNWHKTDCSIHGDTWSVTVPHDATMWYISASDTNGILTSGTIHYPQP